MIFGLRDFAELACFYLSNDSSHEVVAFSVSEAHLPEERSYLGRPVVAFEEVEEKYPVEDFAFFAPMSAARMNLDRKEIFNEVKGKGYECVSYVSSKATYFDNDIGENCFILEDNTIQPQTTIGDNVMLWSGNHIGHHGRIDDHVLFTSHVVMSGHCRIGEHSFFGVNSSIRDGLTIAEGTFLAMSSSLTSDTDPWSAYRGNPAKKLRIPSDKMKM